MRLLLPALLLSSVAAAEPTRVYTGVYAYSISELNISDGTYLLDGYLWFRWAGDALPTDRFDFTVINGTVEHMDEAPVVHQDGQHRLSRRVTLRLRGDFQLANYPFDRQTLPLIIEHRWFGVDQLVFQPDDGAVPKGKALKDAFLASELTIGDWVIDSATHGALEKTYETDFGSIQKGVWDGKSARYQFAVLIKRNLTPYVVKVLVPLLLIVAMAFSVFFISAREFSTQAAVVITALLSCVAFHVSQASSLPSVGYLVKADLFFLLSYAFIFAALAAVVVGNRQVHRDREQSAETLYRALRYVLPIGYSVCSALVILTAG